MCEYKVSNFESEPKIGPLMNPKAHEYTRPRVNASPIYADIYLDSKLKSRGRDDSHSQFQFQFTYSYMNQTLPLILIIYKSERFM